MFAEIKINATQKQQREEFIYILEELYTVLLERKTADPKQSYVASLYHKGINKILQKIGEESYEVILASLDVENMLEIVKDGDAINFNNYPFQQDEQKLIDDLTGELADLWFHCFILLGFFEVDFALIKNELLNCYQSSLNNELNPKAVFILDFSALDKFHTKTLRLVQNVKDLVHKYDCAQSQTHKSPNPLQIMAFKVLDVMYFGCYKLDLIRTVSFYDVVKVLQQRMGVSGLDEKSVRNKQ